MNRTSHAVVASVVLVAGFCASGFLPSTEAEDPPATQTSEKAAASSSNKIMKVNEIEGISEYKLDNGVRILLFPDDSKEVVTVNMTVFVGSRHEGYGEAGMAHLLEHMLFKGTPEHPEIPKVLDERGARFNGTTWVDRTNYYETLPASEDNLRFALKLEADRLLNSFIKGEDLASEMSVVRSEFERGENSPSRVLMQRIQSAAYDWHNYGRSTIGNRSDIERVPVVNLRRFYRKYYRPDNIMLIVAGKFENDQAISLIQETFGDLKSPETPIDPTYTTEPAQDGERTIVLRRVGEVQIVGAAYHVPAASHPDFAAVKALAIVLGHKPSGRLYKGLVEPKIASSASALAFAFAEPGLLMSFANVPAENSIETARADLINILEGSFETSPVSQQEVDRAIQQMLKQRELAASDTTGLAVSLSEWAAQGDWRLYFLFRDIVESLTADDVQRVAKQYLTRNNRTVGLFLPGEAAERIAIPESPDLIAKLKDYKGRAVIQAGEQFDPDPLAIEKRVVRGALKNGFEYALLPKVTRGGSVDLRLALRFGTADSMINRLGAIEMMGILMARGTQTLDYPSLQDELTRLRANLQLNSTPGLLEVTIKTKREFLDQVIRLVGDVLRNPALKDDELKLLQRQIVTGMQQNSTEPQTKAVTAVRRTLSPYGKDDVRYVPTIEEEIERYESATTDEIRDLFQNVLSGQVGELVVVGDFDVDDVKSQFEKVLDDWKADVPYVRVDRPAVPPNEGSLEVINTPDKANAFFYASTQMEMDDTTDEHAALVLGNYILGGGSLTSRLADRVRQQDGLSYTIRSATSVNPIDNRMNFVIYAIANPSNRDRLIEAIEEEVKRITSEGVTQA